MQQKRPEERRTTTKKKKKKEGEKEGSGQWRTPIEKEKKAQANEGTQQKRPDQ